MSLNSVELGLGVTVGYATTTGGSPTVVGQYKGMGGLSHEVGMYDATGCSSTAAEQVPTIFKAGEMPISVFFDPSNATHVALIGYMKAKTALYWTVTFGNPVGPTATDPVSAKTIKFWGYLSKTSLSGFEVESGVEAEFTVAITGDAVYA